MKSFAEVGVLQYESNGAGELIANYPVLPWLSLYARALMWVFETSLWAWIDFVSRKAHFPNLI